MIKNALRALAGLAILAVGIFAMNGLIGMKETPPVKPRPATPRAVKVTAALPDTLVPSLAIEGRVQAMNRMTVLSEVSGRLPLGGKEFREGVQYGAGEVMMRLDESEQQANLVAQRSQWLQLLAGSLADIQLDFPNRADTWSQYVRALKVDQPLDPLPEPASDRERLYLTGRGVISGYHTIRATEERLDKFTVRAPFSGVVTAALVEPGSMVRAGQPLGTLVETEKFEVKAAVHARHLDLLEEGHAVTLTEEGGEAVAQGRVSRISGNVDVATQSASVYCEVQAAQGHTLRDGRFLSGTIALGSMAGVLNLDVQLIEGGEQPAIFTVREGKLELIPVQVLHRDAGRALVSGVAPGTPLLAEPISGAHEGLLVEVINL